MCIDFDSYMPARSRGSGGVTNGRDGPGISCFAPKISRHFLSPLIKKIAIKSYRTEGSKNLSVEGDKRRQLARCVIDDWTKS